MTGSERVRLDRIVAVAFALLLAACSLRQAPPPGAPGDVIYALQNCAICHGHDREGKSNGPGLVDLDRHWTRDTLTEFLGDPRAFEATDPRIAALRDQYSSAMDPYTNLTLAERRVLANWLLAQ